MSVAYTIPALDQTIWLAARPFATGGEGALYRITAPAAYQGYVVKLLHPHKRSADRATKARHLAAHPPPAPPSAQATIVWIQHLIHDTDGHFVGLLMPEASGAQLELLTTAHLPRRHAAEWASWSLARPTAQQQRLALGHALAAAVHALHESGRYVLADLKPDNILVTPDGRLALVDTDSVAVWEQGDLCFKASVATPEYTPPEADQGEGQPTLAWDRFSLAVILYRLLLGVHPFAASAAAPYDRLVTLEHKIQAGLFVPAPVVEARWQSVPPLHRKFAGLHPALQALFVRAFREGHQRPEARPSAHEWAEALAQSHAMVDHPLPSSRFKDLLKTPEDSYHWMVQQTLQHHAPATQGAYSAWGQLPSLDVLKRSAQYYKTAATIGWKALVVMGAVMGVAVVLVSIAMWVVWGDSSGWEASMGVLAVLANRIGNGLQSGFFLILLLGPFLWAMVEDMGDDWLAWRQKKWLGAVSWDQLSRYTLKRLKRWNAKLFRKRSKLRNQLRALKKEQALYTNVKQERERLVQTHYQPQLQQLYTELRDYQTAWEETLTNYDQRAHALMQAEHAELKQATVDPVPQPHFPTLLILQPNHQAIRDQYAQQHAALLAEAQQAYHSHQTALLAHLATWNHQADFAQQLLDQDYCTILSTLEDLDQQVDRQKIALGEIDERLKVVREALR